VCSQTAKFPCKDYIDKYDYEEEKVNISDLVESSETLADTCVCKNPQKRGIRIIWSKNVQSKHPFPAAQARFPGK